MDNPKFPDNYNTYIVTRKDDKRITHSLISALSFVVEMENWYEEKWSIDPIGDASKFVA